MLDDDAVRNLSLLPFLKFVEVDFEISYHEMWKVYPCRYFLQDLESPLNEIFSCDLR